MEKLKIRNVRFTTIIKNEISRIDKYNFRDLISPPNDNYTKEFYNFFYDKDNFGIIIWNARHLLDLFPNYPDYKELINIKRNNYDIDIKRKRIDRNHYYIFLYSFIYELINNHTDNYEEIVIKYDEFIKKNNNGNSYFRGQTDSEWRINPSMFRELKDSIVLDRNGIDYELGEKFNNEYSNLINYNHVKTFYEKVAFAQHSIEYSTLIDVTHSFVIAASFALSNTKKVNDFKFKSACIYEISTELANKDQIRDLVILDDISSIDSFLKSNKITYLNVNKIIPGHNYSADVYDCSGKIVAKENICFNSISSFLKLFVPRFAFFNLPVNDRMTYQQGAFLYFNTCVSINGRVLYELNSNLKITKYIIHPKSKRKILNDILKNHRECDIDHLMDPYKFFAE